MRPLKDRPFFFEIFAVHVVATRRDLNKPPYTPICCPHAPRFDIFFTGTTVATSERLNSHGRDITPLCERHDRASLSSNDSILNSTLYSHVHHQLVLGCPLAARCVRL